MKARAAVFHRGLMVSTDLMFLETSALTGEGVEEVFLKCSKTILTKIETGVLDPEVMGSGVQHGDSRTARELAARRRLGQDQGGCAC